MAVVLVNRPTVQGERVWFSWTSSQQLPKVRGSKFYVEYVGTSVDDLPAWIHLSTAMSLLVSQMQLIPGKHLLVFEGSVPAWVARLWGAYHAAKNVAVMVDQFEDDKDAPVAEPVGEPRFGVLFGGGKDSLFALDLIREAFPNAPITLISYTHPRPHVRVEQLELRRATFAVRGAAERYGADVALVRTNARTVFDAFFHTELYTASVLPILYRTDISALTFSYEYGHYFTGLANGARQLGFRRSRPEHNIAISRAYSRALDRELHLFNANAFMSELSTFLYLARKRPSFADEVMMCESTADPSKRWCRNCTKCAEYALFSTYAGIEGSELPASSFLADSPWIQRMVPEVRRRLADHGTRSARWFPGLSTRTHFDSVSHVIGRLVTNPPKDMNGEALANLRLLADAYAVDRPENEVAYEDALRRNWPAHLQDRVLEVVRSRFEVSPTGPATRSWGEHSVTFDPDVRDKALETYQPPSPPASLANELVALGTRVTDPQLVIDASADPMQVRALGGIRRDQLMIARSSRWVDVHATVGAPQKGDGFVIAGTFGKPDHIVRAELCARVSIPYAKKQRGWLRLRIRHGTTTVLDVDIADVGGSFFMTTDAHADSVELEIEVVAVRHCRDWSWGAAMRTCVEVHGWHPVAVERNPRAQLTYSADGTTANGKGRRWPRRLQRVMPVLRRLKPELLWRSVRGR